MTKPKTKDIPWTLFWDMHSGGGCKEPPYEKIYIQAPQEEAEIIFYKRFGHNPHRVSCTCCGSDYSIDQYDTLEQASAYHRNCKWSDNEKGYIEECRYTPKQLKEYGMADSKHFTVAQYIKKKNVLVIRAKNIKKEERVGTLPQQGYVWMWADG